MRRIAAALVLSVGIAQPVQAVDPATQAVALQALSTLSSVLSITNWLASNRQVGYVVTVRGTGSNVIEAQNVAYMRAIDEAVGAYIGSHTEVRNGQVVRQDIVKHVTGYVNKFEILEQGDKHVVMRVWVQDANIARGLLPVHTNNGVIDGYQTSVQVKTLDASNQGAKDTLKSVLYAVKDGTAMTVKTGEPVTVRSASAGWTTQIPIEVKWRHEYLLSLIRVSERVRAAGPGFWDYVGNALEKVGTTCNQPVSAHDCRGPSEKMELRNISVITRKEGDWIGRNNVIALDSDKWEVLADTLYTAQYLYARVEVTGSKQGTVIDQCVDISQGQMNNLVMVGSTDITVNENGYHRSTLVLPLLKDDRYTVKIKLACS